ncbi:hypothetical protein [Armatimonas rosea]|uniref:Uncharacterized protein n=1 Tax=Armatimonas rosea TaxID=685828 RepID=A0A7W9SP65_ARMRO|nr:hypothetical protein [Armatimonas rosea]MBB6050186.1 hypothetical protein [Armatimonas rosea]
MTNSLKLSLFVAALTVPCLVGCQKGGDVVKDDPKAIAADAAKAGSNAAPAPVPQGAQGQMSDALNNPNTPPEVKAKIRAQMGGGGR